MNTSTLTTEENISEVNKVNSSKTELVEMIDGSPIAVIQTEGGYFAAWGNRRLTELYKSKEELYNHLETWDFKIIVMSIIIDITNQLNNK